MATLQFQCLRGVHILTSTCRLQSTHHNVHASVPGLLEATINENFGLYLLLTDNNYAK